MRPSEANRLGFLNGPAATTGVNDIDLWVGGLAEKQMPFGGLLGSTFNFVFETQLENLQNGDRFYYLQRTAGLDFAAALENNSFSKLIMLNTDATHLPKDVFSTPDVDTRGQPGCTVHRPRRRRPRRSHRRHRPHSAGHSRRPGNGCRRNQLPALHRRGPRRSRRHRRQRHDHLQHRRRHPLRRRRQRPHRRRRRRRQYQWWRRRRHPHRFGW